MGRSGIVHTPTIGGGGKLQPDETAAVLDNKNNPAKMGFIREIVYCLLQKWIGLYNCYMQPSDTKDVKTLVFRYVYHFKRVEIMAELTYFITDILLTNKMVYSPVYIVTDIQSIIELKIDNESYKESDNWENHLSDVDKPSEEKEDTHDVVTDKELQVIAVLTPEIEGIHDIVDKTNQKMKVLISPPKTGNNTDESTNSELDNTIDVSDIFLGINVQIDEGITTGLIANTREITTPEITNDRLGSTNSTGFVSNEDKSNEDTPRETQSSDNPDIDQQINEMNAKIEKAKEILAEIRAVKATLAAATRTEPRTERDDSENGSGNSNQTPRKDDSQYKSTVTPNDKNTNNNNNLLELCIRAKTFVYNVSMLAARLVLNTPRRQTGGTRNVPAENPDIFTSINQLLNDAKNVFLGTKIDENPPEDNIGKQLQETLDRMRKIVTQYKPHTDPINKPPAKQSAQSGVVPNIKLSFHIITDDYKKKNESQIKNLVEPLASTIAGENIYNKAHIDMINEIKTIANKNNIDVSIPINTPKKEEGAIKMIVDNMVLGKIQDVDKAKIDLTEYYSLVDDVINKRTIGALSSVHDTYPDDNTLGQTQNRIIQAMYVNDSVVE